LISGIKAKESKVGILTDAKTYQYNYWFWRCKTNGFAGSTVDTEDYEELRNSMENSVEWCFLGVFLQAPLVLVSDVDS
jgi:hypothetical protein